MKRIRANHSDPWWSGTLLPEDGPLWWSNEDGWVDSDSATIFTDDEAETLTLPLGGEWVPFYPEIHNQHVMDLYAHLGRYHDGVLRKMRLPDGNMAMPHRAMARYYMTMVVREAVKGYLPEDAFTDAPKKPI